VEPKGPQQQETSPFGEAVLSGKPSQDEKKDQRPQAAGLK
jgi:hypothetical protein